MACVSVTASGNPLLSMRNHSLEQFVNEMFSPGLSTDILLISLN